MDISLQAVLPLLLLPRHPARGHLRPLVLLQRPQREAAGPAVVDAPRLRLALPARAVRRVAEQDGAVPVPRGRHRLRARAPLSLRSGGEDHRRRRGGRAPGPLGLARLPRPPPGAGGGALAAQGRRLDVHLGSGGSRHWQNCSFAFTALLGFGRALWQGLEELGGSLEFGEVFE